MAENKNGGRGVVASIERLRVARYMTRGPGAKPKRDAKATVDQLRAAIDVVVGTKPKRTAKKKRGTAKKGKKR